MHPLSLLFLPFLTFKKKKTSLLLLSPSSFSLSASLFCPGSWNTLFPPSDCMSCWLALPFHASPPSCARLQLPFFSSLFRGGMSALNHMISPNDKPSLCKPATQRQGVLCRVMMRHVQEDGDAQKSSLCHV